MNLVTVDYCHYLSIPCLKLKSFRIHLSIHSRQHWHRQWSIERASGQSSSRFTRRCAVAGKPRRRFLGASSTVSTRDVSWQALIGWDICMLISIRDKQNPANPLGWLKHVTTVVNFHGIFTISTGKGFCPTTV